MKKIAIIGASYLQEPLIKKAKERGLETHVFAWECGDVGEFLADYFYPISIVEKDQILEKCIELKIDGICTIASDLAVSTVNYVAEKMNLIGNSIHSGILSTNKHEMRLAFEKNNDPSPKSFQIASIEEFYDLDIEFPLIVKPVDRSGSRGITKIYDIDEAKDSINNALKESFSKKVLVEEYVSGKEFSVEFISWEGKHYFLAMTEKFTTGSPNFIETGHMEPANVDNNILDNVISVVSHALDSLEVKYGASHSEIKIADGNIKIIEIGSRMGGDFIGSSLVELSTGFDFVNAVIDVSLGIEPEIKINELSDSSAIRFVVSNEDIKVYNKLKILNPEIYISSDIHTISNEKVKDSSSRFGYFIMRGDRELLKEYMPVNEEDV